MSDSSTTPSKNGLETMIKLRAPVCVLFIRQPSPLICLLAENYADPSGKLWSMYLTEAKKRDDQVTNNWTEDTGGVLVFVSFKVWFYIGSMY